MIFQDPMTSLNPYLTIEEQLTEVSILHEGLSKKDARKKALDLLDQVRIPDADSRLGAYPHELSGGMRQRVMIAMALLCEPDLLFADEPTTALDVTTQAQILDLILELRRDRNLSVVLITHDLGVVAGTCDRVLVMYAGRLVEEAPSKALFTAPAHPYTQALIASVPRVDARVLSHSLGIEGLPPRLDQGPFSGCTFAPRCPRVRPECRDGEPPLIEFDSGRRRRCIVPVSELSRAKAPVGGGS
jgi:oligopeptide transport system ATP-binding protein